MLNESAPPGKELKYAQVERERRFLLDGPPPGEEKGSVRITDRYLTGTRLRLRRMVEAGDRPIYKLTQKVPGSAGRPGLITTLYLDEAEYALLSQLPAAVLTKIRHRVPPLGVDQFLGPLAGLYLAEAEFEDDAESDGFARPPFSVAEVTGDPRFTGGQLATATREDVSRALADYGVSLR